MESDQRGQLFVGRENDVPNVLGLDGKCEDTTDLGETFKEINKVYTERLLKLDDLGDSTELKMKLLYLWLADLLEQNASLVDTVGELERVAAERVQLLEDNLRKSSSSVHQYMTKIQAADGITSMSLRSLVSLLELDIGSLLELIRRARTVGCWDIRGLVFHEVSYWDIFGSAPPPPSAPRKDEATESPKNDRELEKLKAEVEFWRTRAKKAEAETRLSGETGRPGDGEALRRELEQARRLAAERAEEIQALGHKLDVTEQRGKDVQAALAAEVAEKHDQAVQLRQRLHQMEEDLHLAHMQTQFRDEIIKGMRKEVKRFRSQVAFQRRKFMNLADYFHDVHEEVRDLDRKFEEPDLWKEQLALVPVTAMDVPKTNGEDGEAEDAVHLFTFAMCELAEEVDKVVKETAEEARRHRHTELRTVLNTLKAATSHGLEAGDSRSEVAAPKRQLELLQTRLRSAQQEVASKAETITKMANAAGAQDAVVRERESRIQECEKEIAKNEDVIRNLTAALAEQQERNGDLREAVMITQQQLRQLEGRETDVGATYGCS